MTSAFPWYRTPATTDRRTGPTRKRPLIAGVSVSGHFAELLRMMLRMHEKAASLGGLYVLQLVETRGVFMVPAPGVEPGTY